MLRPYQTKIANKAFQILSDLKIVYLSLEMRVGKTLIALETANLCGAESVLFITKKKAISSIEKDFKREDNFRFRLNVVNYEQVHKCDPSDYDLIIVDEAHSLGKYPKPSLRTKRIRKIVGEKKLILLSGTPSPESYSQLFHQFWVSDHSPFDESNFYKWAKAGYVKVKEVYRNGFKLNDYSNADQTYIMELLNQYFINFTREEAGFTQSEVIEKVIKLPCPPQITQMVSTLLRDRYYAFVDGTEILCDSALKLQSKIHQVFSGTVKTETGEYKILSPYKAEFIKKHYIDTRIAIFYKFVAEGEILRKMFAGEYTEDPMAYDQFKSRIFLSQIQTGSMGISLASADILIFYNIDFSAVQYWQARSRLQTLNRISPPIVHWLFSDIGIEHKIMNVIIKKKSYTTKYFKKDFLNGTKDTDQDNQLS
jgi:SNF2 family DNA or RNA helicase